MPGLQGGAHAHRDRRAPDAEGGEVLAGSLHCAHCDERYPIDEGIPNLLPPDLRREMEAEAARTPGGGSA